MTSRIGQLTRSIILLKRYKPDGDAPRDFKSYDGRGASKALLLAAARSADGARIMAGDRAITLELMAVEQVEREQAREGMVVA